MSYDAVACRLTEGMQQFVLLLLLLKVRFRGTELAKGSCPAEVLPLSAKLLKPTPLRAACLGAAPELSDSLSVGNVAAFVVVCNHARKE